MRVTPPHSQRVFMQQRRNARPPQPQRCAVFGCHKWEIYGCHQQLVAALARRDPNSPPVFHRNGIAIRRWRTAWRAACQAAGVPTRCLHDCRPTAARNPPAPDVRRHATLRQSWMQRENWEFETYRPERTLFGSDSSCFPRCWQHAVLAAQRAALEELDLDAASQAAIFAGNFNRVFGGGTSPPGRMLAQGRSRGAPVAAPGPRAGSVTDGASTAK